MSLMSLHTKVIRSLHEGECVVYTSQFDLEDLANRLDIQKVRVGIYNDLTRFLKAEGENNTPSQIKS